MCMCDHESAERWILSDGGIVYLLENASQGVRPQARGADSVDLHSVQTADRRPQPEAVSTSALAR